MGDRRRNPPRAFAGQWARASAENLERFRASYFDQLPKSLQVRSGRVLPGVRELLTALRDVPNVTRSLLTGNMERSAWIKLRHYGLAEHFRVASSAIIIPVERCG